MLWLSGGDAAETGIGHRRAHQHGGNKLGVGEKTNNAEGVGMVKGELLTSYRRRDDCIGEVRDHQ
jgi:hypothetical protein